jgi:transposase
LSDNSFAKMWNRISDEDPTAQILSAWIAKEELRTLLSTVRVGCGYRNTDNSARRIRFHCTRHARRPAPQTSC